MREYKPGEFRPRGARLVRTYRFGAAIMASVGGLGIVGSVLLKSWAHPTGLGDWLRLGLIVASLGMVAGWLWVVDAELDLLLEWLDPVAYEPPSDQRQMLFASFFAVTLVLTTVAAVDPTWYGLMFTATSAAALIATKNQINPEIATAIAETRERLDRKVPAVASGYNRILDALQSYYLGRPHLKRYAVSCGIGLLGVALSVLHTTLDIQVFRTLAYTNYVVGLVASESVVFAWRGARDRAIRTELIDVRRALSAAELAGA